MGSLYATGIVVQLRNKKKGTREEKQRKGTSFFVYRQTPVETKKRRERKYLPDIRLHHTSILSTDIGIR